MSTVFRQAEAAVFPDSLHTDFLMVFRAYSLFLSQLNALNNGLKPISATPSSVSLYPDLTTISKHNQFLSYYAEDETIWRRKEKLEWQRCGNTILILCPNTWRGFVFCHFSAPFVNTFCQRIPALERTLKSLWSMTSRLMYGFSLQTSVVSKVTSLSACAETKNHICGKGQPGFQTWETSCSCWF